MGKIIDLKKLKCNREYYYRNRESILKRKALYHREYYYRNRESILKRRALYRPIYYERNRQFRKLSPLEKQQYFEKKYGNQKT